MRHFSRMVVTSCWWATRSSFMGGPPAGGASATALEELLDLGQQRLGVDGFVEVGVDVHRGEVGVCLGAEVEAQLAAHRRGDDDRHAGGARVTLALPREGEAGVDAGHHEVGDHQVGGLFGDALLRLRGIGGRDHAVTRALEDETVDLEKVVIVVDDQYEWLVSGPGRPQYSFSGRGARARPAPVGRVPVSYTHLTMPTNREV